MSASQIAERTCARDGCDQTFTPKTARRVYCSDSCRALVSKRSVSKSGAASSARTRVAAVAAIEPALTWEPPSEPRMTYQTAEPCPACGTLLTAEPRGTWRGCLTCKRAVAPPGVSAPYASGANAPQRQVKSQRERDQEARALESRRQRLADQLDGQGADKRLTSEARGALKWYRAEVDQAKTMSRLDDLVEQFRGERLTRTGWLARPAVAEIEPADDDDGQADEPAPAPLAITAPAQVVSGRAWTLPGPAGAMTWAGALARAGWRMVPSATGCQVSEGAAACGAQANRRISGGLVCYDHYQNLTAIITGSTP